MSYYKKNNHRKTSSSSSSSSENNLLQNNEQSSRQGSQISSSSRSSAKKKLIYPNVPKRTQQLQQCSSINNDTIQTESQINIIPSEIQSQKCDTYASNILLSNQNAYTRHTLDLITKYTSPQKLLTREPHDHSISPVQNHANNITNHQSKNKRTLSPLNETNQQNHESKRTKSFDIDDNDEDELSQFLDHRCNRKISSQNNTTTISSQITIDSDQRKPTARKPTVRKLSTNQQKPTISQIEPIEQSIKKSPVTSDEILIIELDVDTEEENIIDRERTTLLSKHSQDSSTEIKNHSTNSKSNPIIPYPIRLHIDNHIDSLNSINKTYISDTPTKSSNLICSTSNNVSMQTFENSINKFSPCSNLERRRRYSSTSTNSFLFDTPCSSFSRTTTNNTISNSPIKVKHECETQTLLPTNIDMIHELILHMNENKYKIDYNSIEISKKLFYQCSSFFSTNKYPTINSLIKKQFFNFGRYEIEVLFPINNKKTSSIYACDICLKHFYGSSIAFQRHNAKCLSIQPPGKLVYKENDLAIFQIGETKLNIKQYIYIKSLCRIARLFINSNKSIDDTKIDRFTYYILCRRDPILSQCQPSLYRFIGYFSKQANQHVQQSINNLSCLFILPPFAQHQEYNQLLIAFSYFLIRSNASENLIYSSPARPLNIISLSAFQIYWRDIVLAYIINHNPSSIKTITLDTLARQTFIHPRDILSSLYSNGFIVPHPNDKSSVYLLNNAYQSISSRNLHIRNKSLFMNMKLINTNDENKIMTDKKNIDKETRASITMPVFHTKTIESILEPVAQQVSRLVILHEESSDDNNLIPDLSKPVQIVKSAVDNLVKVIHETCLTSTDDLLRSDMPQALARVNKASTLLIDAAHILKYEPCSIKGRQMLIEGARCILQGISALLLTFDESEVRKIVIICQHVLNHLSYVEMIETIEQLVDFVKNLTPILTRMSKEVDLRIKELTHIIHRQLLTRSLEQVKTLTPLLISSINVYITSKYTGGHTIVESIENRDYVVNKMSDELGEIIRILQLITIDDVLLNEFDEDEQHNLKKLLKTLGNRLYQAKNWLSNSQALEGTLAERSLRMVLDDLRIHITEHCLDEKQADMLMQKVDAISQMMNRLLQLRVQSKGDTSEATSLSRNISQQLDDLYRSLEYAINLLRYTSDYQRPATTVNGKVDQAQRWLSQPDLDQFGFGEFAIRSLIKIGRQLVSICELSYRRDLLECCLNIENLLLKYKDLLRRRLPINGPECVMISRSLSSHISQLQRRLQEAIIYQVSDDFMDITSTIKILRDVTFQSSNEPNRQELFQTAMQEFINHSSTLTQTARLAANGTSCRSKSTIETINITASQINDLTPQVIYAARIGFGDPTSSSTTEEHFDLLRDQWLTQMEYLRLQVDEAIPSDEFVKACEEAIIHDTQQTEKAVADLNPSIIIDSTSNIIRRANRILLVTYQEIENSEDSTFTTQLQKVSNAFKETFQPMIAAAKQLALNPDNKLIHSKWQQTNNELIDAIGNIREILQPITTNLVNDIAHISFYHDSRSSSRSPPPRPPLPSDEELSASAAPPRPPLPVFEPRDEETYDKDLPLPQPNQPMLMAAHDLHMNIKQYSSHDNELIALAKKMTHFIAQLSLLIRGETGTKRDLISISRELAEMSEHITYLAKQIAKECTDRRMRTHLLQVSERIPTIGTQLKILSTVKATMFGIYDSEEDAEATEMLISNAQNLMQSIKETVKAAEIASDKLRPMDNKIRLRWTRRTR
ncbi:unnamed protein product [Rotaria sp. Silwood1]|nr:unnamed protein product [Rotaria sp. Silwood1]CAF1270783.1 unnamed protein product [Rotaria sp. Silwood1]